MIIYKDDEYYDDCLRCDPFRPFNTRCSNHPPEKRV